MKKMPKKVRINSNLTIAKHLRPMSWKMEKLEEVNIGLILYESPAIDLSKFTLSDWINIYSQFDVCSN